MLLSVTIPFMTGCATTILWARALRPGETLEAQQSAFYAERAACHTVANSQVLPDYIDMAMKVHLFQDCMMGYGWRQKKAKSKND
jgi:hypothetical protein